MALAYAMGNRVQQMRLAEPGGCMNEQRIERHRRTGGGIGDPQRGGMGQTVGRADHEAVEILVGIKSTVLTSHDCDDRYGLRLTDHGLLRLAQMHDIGTDPDLHRVEMAEFGLTALVQPRQIMGLDPVLEKTGRNRNRQAAAAQFLRLNPRKPTRKQVLAQFGAQPLRYAIPLLPQNHRCLCHDSDSPCPALPSAHVSPGSHNENHSHRSLVVPVSKLCWELSLCRLSSPPLFFSLVRCPMLSVGYPGPTDARSNSPEPSTPVKTSPNFQRMRKASPNAARR